MKFIISLLLLSSFQVFANDTLSFRVELEVWGDGADVDEMVAAKNGWKKTENEDEETIWILSVKDLDINKLPYSQCISDACFKINKTKKGSIAAQFEYDANDNRVTSSTYVYPGYPGILEFHGNDNSTWSVTGKAIIHLKKTK